MSEEWDWIEVPLAELGRCQTFEDVTQRYRRSRPVGMITRLEGLEDFVVLNLLAPVHAAFWSVARLDAFSGVFAHLADAGCQPENKKVFLKDLRKAGVKLADPAIRLFDLYTEHFPSRANKVPGYSRGGVATPERFRMVSSGCHERLLSHVIAHFESEVRQFAEYGLFRIDDTLSIGFPLLHDRLSCGAYLFQIFAPLHDYGETWRAAWQKDILFQLEWALARVSAGERLELPIEPQFVLRPNPCFVLRGKESPPNRREIDDPVCRTILSLRARLVRLLGWPVFYDGVCRALTPQDTYQPLRPLDEYGILEPFNVIQELEAYREEMEARYPCLLGYPFKSVNTETVKLFV